MTPVPTLYNEALVEFNTQPDRSNVAPNLRTYSSSTTELFIDTLILTQFTLVRHFGTLLYFVRHYEIRHSGTNSFPVWVKVAIREVAREQLEHNYFTLYLQQCHQTLQTLLHFYQI